jgi:hypothetical protein
MSIHHSFVSSNLLDNNEITNNMLFCHVVHKQVLCFMHSLAKSWWMMGAGGQGDEGEGDEHEGNLVFGIFLTVLFVV